MAEIHTKDADIVYVLEGTATLVTGGTAVDAKVTEPDELRGSSISGGEAHPLQKGDVIIVPAGVPHWFKEVSNPFLYYVVKSAMRTLCIPLLLVLAGGLAGADLGNRIPDTRPEASVNLMTSAGAKLVQAQWRYSDTKIIEVDFTGPGADGQPTRQARSRPTTTRRTPAAPTSTTRVGSRSAPTSLEQRRSTGRLCFNWYRISITIPEKVGELRSTRIDGGV